MKNAKADLDHWRKHNKKIADRIEQLIQNIELNPYTGLGKPEPLCHNRSGYWSRRITKEHRLLYRVLEDGEVLIIQCRYHYHKSS
tara:strand:- start:8493 stop:8747 length:255 start_codon:yes stop_codon:yes gene_type:complete